MADGAEAGEVAIQRDQVAAVLHRDSADDRVRDEVADRVGLVAQPAHQGNVAGPWSDGDVQRLRAGRFDERERVGSRRWNLEDPAIGGQAQERGPDHHGNREGLVARECLVEPRADRAMVGMVVTVRGEDDVDVEEEHPSAPGVEFEPFVERLVQRPV